MALNRPPKPDFMDEEEWKQLADSREPLQMMRQSEDERPDFMNEHARRYIETNGGEGTDITQGGLTCLVWHTGAKSGVERVTPLNYKQEGELVYVVGSLAGLDQHPHWVHNLEANPETEVQIYEKRWRVKARLLSGDERAALWPRLTEYFPLWGHFQKYSDREFKVFELSPID
ncbi:MAG: nitroreductase family deazaflavin-dependent oxidoreductase [Gammaproteobacteria bacterium]|jgi:deazaflavin-dependent oxidoreductase (nitroreductase family)|nr:nitroreductase family deazaflavin-dependent oxidoreductase [Gammaproteobacteria bacterium]MBT7369421.1 nitroreductase family deazaflavin-dependent oxidoreductase [Gammaproteobacteria bacterium]